MSKADKSAFLAEKKAKEGGSSAPVTGKRKRGDSTGHTPNKRHKSDDSASAPIAAGTAEEPKPKKKKKKQVRAERAAAEVAPTFMTIDTDAAPSDEPAAVATPVLVARTPTTPSTFHAIMGEGARPEIHLKLHEYLREGELLKARDIQDLILWVIGDGTMPKWAFVKNKTLIPKVAVIMASSLSGDVYARHMASMPHFAAIFPNACPTQAPGNKQFLFSFMNVLLRCPMTKKEKKQKKKQKQAEKEKVALPAPSHYVLTPTDLRANDYPLPADFPGTADPRYPFTRSYDPAAFVPTQRRPEHVTRHEHHVVALDCEMVQTGTGLELARVTLLDGVGALLEDMLVVPDVPIVDYLTRFSGISAALLEGVSTRLADAQRAVMKHVFDDTILVGHSLENDLKALQMMHLKVADTAVLFPDTRGPRYRRALRALAFKYLDRTIQAGDGHDSTEDARAALDLFLAKVANGPSYGEPEDDTEGLFERLERCERSCALVDRARIVSAHASGSVDAYPCASDSETRDKLVRAIAGRAEFVWGQFHDLEQHYADRECPSDHCVPSPPFPSAVAQGTTEASATLPVDVENDTVPERPRDDAAVAPILSRIDNHVRAVYDALPSGALFVVVTGNGDQGPMRELTARKRRRAGDWTPEQEAALESAVAAARIGMAYFAVKP